MTNRYIALDAFRGLTIALMILVNTPGSWSYVYAPLLHASWHGVTPTDLIFPFFLFIIGSALFFSLANKNKTDTSTQVKNIVKRSAIMFLLGLLLNAYGHLGELSEIRIMGVLQRLGLAYGVAALCILFFNTKQIIGLSVVILMAYWGIFYFSQGDIYSLNDNVIRQVDLVIMGANHMWGGKGIAFDPEGLLSTLPSVVNVFVGFLATRLLMIMPSKRKSVIALVLGGIWLMLFGLFWGQWHPINKSLWTGSYVLFSSGCAFLLLALFIWLVDIKQQLTLVSPLLVYGTNPMFIYIVSWLWATTYYLIIIGESTLYDTLYQLLADVLPQKLASLTFALIHVLIFYGLSLWLYKRKIFIKV
jgi:predicted acyltransferase